MKCPVILNILLLTIASTCLAEDETIVLFDGETLNGWTRYGGKHEYTSKSV